MRWVTACILLWFAAFPAAGQGHLDTYPAFASQYVTARQIEVWTPEGYDPSQPLPVIYMQDGQMLWDASQTWNKQAWNVPQIMSQLIKAGKIPPTIIVGIDNGGPQVRGREYLPAKIFNALSQAERDTITQAQGAPLSDEYLRFLVHEVKPFVDSHYATQNAAAHTFIMGSSMGGLISFYAQAEYPEVFGASASLSMHWLLATSKIRKEMPDPVIYGPEVEAAFAAYLETAKASPGSSRYYVDQGTATLDAYYRAYSLRFEGLMKARGWTTPDFSSQIFPGEDHSEAAWAKRLDIPLQFLLTGKVVKSGTLIRMPQVPSKFVTPRDVQVWLPDGYDAARRYKVVYMMDGQNVFEPSPWSHADWGVVDTLPGMIETGKVPPAIVVAIDNVEGRTAEYDPQRIYDILPPDYQSRARDFAGGRTPNSDNFLKFVVTELKPMIDATYSTIPGPDGTSIMGSSSGGHIALYAQGQYPKVFGASASLSMPWLMAGPAKDDVHIKADVAVLTTAYRMWLRGTGMKPGRNRIYTDQGTAGLDGLFTPYEESAVAMLRAEGWDDKNLTAPVYNGAEHSEKDWRARISIPLQFVLGTPATTGH